MKQNKRFWLVALVVLLAMTLVSGLALGEKSLIDKVRGGEKNADGTWKTEYTFYGMESADGKTYVGLTDKDGNTNEDAPLTLTVALRKDAEAGNVQFDFTGNLSAIDADQQGFIFESDGQASKKLTVTEVKNKEGVVQGATLTWDAKSFETFKLTITAIDDIKDGKPVKGASETFTINIKKISVVGLKVKEDKKWVSSGAFTYNLTDYVEDAPNHSDGKLHVAEKYADDGYTPITRKSNLFGFVWAKENTTTYTDVTGKEVTISADVAFDIIYDPDTARTIDPNFTNRIESQVAGFTFQPQKTDVGNMEALKQYAQKGRASTYLDWAQKAGKAEIVITPVDDKEKAIKDLGTATAVLTFKENPETEINIKSKDANDKECKVLRIMVNQTKSVYQFSTYDEKGELIDAWYTTEIRITDANGNKIEPTYVLPGKDELLQDLIWSSSDPSIIRVTKDGKITGIKVGTAEAIATGHFGAQAKVKVEVIKEAASKITSIKFNQDPAEYELPINSSRRLVPYVITEPAVSRNDFVNEVEVESSDPNVISLVNGYTDPNGDYRYYSDAPRMIPHKKGTATITVYPKGKPELAVTAKFTVVESEVTAKFLKDEISIAVNESENLATYLTYKDPSYVNSTILWASSDPEIVTMSGAYAYGKKEGSATVTATLVNSSDDILTTASIKVNVGKQKLTGIAFGKDAYTVSTGKTVDLFVTVSPVTEYFNADDYTYDFDDDTIASVSYFGEKKVVIYGQKPGKTVFTLTNKADKGITAKATVTVEAVKLESIKLKKDTMSLYYFDNKDSSSLNDHVSGSTGYFSSGVKYVPSNAYIDKDAWTYESSNDDVAFVTDEGTIIATGAGTAVITGTYDDGVNEKIALKLTVTVKGKKNAEPEPEPEPEPAKSNPIKVLPEDGKYYVNVVKGAKNTKQLTAYDAVTGEEVDVKWTSANLEMATVSKTGLVKAKGKGRVTITATTLDGTQKYNIGLTLNQKPVEQINVLYKKVELKVGEKFIVGASVYPKHAYNQELGYKSSNKKVVTVDSGILTAKKPGTATITISAKDGSGVKATVEVTVVK